MRTRLATVLLLALLTVPVLATTAIGSKWTNLLGTVLLVGFCGLMSPELVSLVRRRRERWLAPALVVGALVCIGGWAAQGRPFLTESRFWLYVGLLVLVPAFAAWLSHVGQSGLRAAVWAKLGVTAFAMLLIALGSLAGATTADLPIYRNVRHLNYDLTVALVLTGFLVLVVRHRVARAGLVALLAALGWFTVWSGGRGQLLALAVVAAALVASGRIPWRRRETWLAPLALAGGLVAVVLSGRSGLLATQLDRTLSPDASAFTSGRVGLWWLTLREVTDSFGGLLFGHGPDAFDRMHLGHRLVPGQDVVHPHNAVVQWLLEFGLVGTALLLTLGGWLVLRAARAAAGAGVPAERRVAGALVLGMAAYAMTDGVFYHVVPLTVTTLLVGLLLAPEPAVAERGAALSPGRPAPRTAQPSGRARSRPPRRPRDTAPA